MASPPVQLRTVVFPIFELEDRSISRFAGTCFALHGSPSILITAAHVLEDCKSGSVCILVRDRNNETYPMGGSDWTVDRENDLALLNLEGMPSEMWALPLAANMVGATDSVFTFEFSPVTPRLAEEGMKRFSQDAYTHVGNILTHHYELDESNQEYSRRFETSYPALRGASGSPVMAVHNNAVLGVLIRNHSVPLADEGVMNFGEAVSLSVLERVLRQHGVHPTRIDT